VGEQEHVFTALHSPLESFIPLLTQLLAAARLPPDKSEDSVRQVLASQEEKHQFDTSNLIDGLQEKIKAQYRLELQLPLVSIEGRLVVSDRHLYFQPLNSLAPKKVLALRLGEKLGEIRYEKSGDFVLNFTQLHFSRLHF
jgi:hypothetical protein